MPALSSLARISLNGFRTGGVDGFSPIDSQAQVLYEAARHYAVQHGFDFNPGGYQGPLVMKQLTSILFGNNPNRDPQKHDAVLYRALRASGAARCINHGPDHLPLWVIAPEMPPALPDVARAIASGSAGIRPQARPLVPTDAERKLTKKEAGEDRPAGEVTVRTVTVTAASTSTISSRRQLPPGFIAAQEEKAALHRQLVNRIEEEIATSPQPLTSRDILTLIAADGLDLHMTTVNGVLGELLEMGKIVSRKETKEEALIRGGGKVPKATRPLLYASAPGPVKTRTSLPPGIKPHMSIDERVLAELSRKYPKGTPSRPRSVGRLSAIVDASPAETRAALERLIKRGVVYKNEQSSTYFVASRRRGPKQQPEQHTVATVTDGVTAETPPEPTGPAVKRHPVVTPDSPARPLINEIGRLVGELAALAGTADTDRVPVLEERVRELEAQNADLSEKLATLRSRVSEILG